VNGRCLHLDEDFKRWQEITQSSGGSWIEDHVTRLNGNGAHFYKGDVDGHFMRITPAGELMVSTYEDAIPHIAKAFFTVQARRDCGIFDEALKAACDVGGIDFMTDMLMSSPLEQDEPDSSFEMKM